MGEFETGYHALGSYYDDETETPPSDNIIHVVPDSSKSRWNHIENLDEFFARIYQYHQRGGFACMVLQDVLQLLQFMFVVLFSVFLMNCVNYQILFDEVVYNHSHKVTITESVLPLHQCANSLDPIIIICLIIALVFWLLRLIKVIYNIFKYVEIRSFFVNALKISSDDLINMTWHEVQRQLLEVQKDLQMCIHKSELTELDIYHRILRFKNYMVAMVNKSLLPLKHRIPFVGESVLLSTGLKYNLEMILFWGPWSPFENNWHLKPDYKSHHKRKELAKQLSNRIFWIGIANFILCPIIFLWQILYSFFRYAELIKREPGFLGSRMWTNYARLYLRHFNELDHELNARLNRGYRPATKYMNIFTSPIVVIIAKHMAFFSGSILAVILFLTIIDEDVLAVQHVIATMTILGAVLAVCRSCIPDEHIVFCPELLMSAILAQVHYIPDHWKGNAHTIKIRDEFSQLFQYKAVCLTEELFSPIYTPLILCFSIRHKSLEIVDFFRNFTVEVTGVGDVCSFAQMDVRKHGNPTWVDDNKTQANQYQQAEDGKTEMSLVHFTLTNPEWKPPEIGSVFINELKEQAQKEATTTLPSLPEANAFLHSLNSLSSIGYGYTSMVSSIAQQSAVSPSTHVGSRFGASSQISGTAYPAQVQTPGGHQMKQLPIRGCGLARAEGPLGGSGKGLLASINNSGGLNPAGTPSSAPTSAMADSHRGTPKFDEDTLEAMSVEMSFSAIYMHELHRRRLHAPFYDEDAHERELWQPLESPANMFSPGGAAAAAANMPIIDEDQEVNNGSDPSLPLLGHEQSPRNTNVTKSC